MIKAVVEGIFSSCSVNFFCAGALFRRASGLFKITSRRLARKGMALATESSWSRL